MPDISTLPNPSQRNSFKALLSLFFMWGFITVMNDVLIGAFEKIFKLSTLQSSLVQSAFFGAYFLVSLLYYLYGLVKGDLLNQIGYKNGMLIGIGISSVSCISFIIAAQLSSYPFFLGSLFLLASGITLLQITANPYATLLGPPDTASARLNLAQGLNSLGTTVGPIAGTLLIYQVFSTQEVLAVAQSYMLYGGLFFLCAIAVFFSPMPAWKNPQKDDNSLNPLQSSYFRWGMLSIFLYVGAEVSLGSYLGKFTTELLHIPRSTANFFLAYYWGGLMIGRFVGAELLKDSKRNYSKMQKITLIYLLGFGIIYFCSSLRWDSVGGFMLDGLSAVEVLPFILIMFFHGIIAWYSSVNASINLGVFSLCIIGLLLMVIFAPTLWSFWSMIGIGLFNSVFWSNIFSMSIAPFEAQKSKGSSLLVMCIVGGACIPPLQGWMVDLFSMRLSFFIPVACYIGMFIFSRVTPPYAD